jgi:hypothetical protein
MLHVGFGLRLATHASPKQSIEPLSCTTEFDQKSQLRSDLTLPPAVYRIQETLHS